MMHLTRVKTDTQSLLQYNLVPDVWRSFQFDGNLDLDSQSVPPSAQREDLAEQKCRNAGGRCERAVAVPDDPVLRGGNIWGPTGGMPSRNAREGKPPEPRPAKEKATQGVALWMCRA